VDVASAVDVTSTVDVESAVEERPFRAALRRNTEVGPLAPVVFMRPASQIAPRNPRSNARGFTLMELIVASTILTILTLMAIPLARVTIQREKEKQLRQALWDMRDAIDRYKDAADRQVFQTKVDSQGYPPDLETLVKGVEGQGGKKYRFLRTIPTDPMTNSKEWGLRSMQDDADSDSWGGQNVFDVYTKSQGQGLDGSKYKDW
jgi:general secretion pathway protein G